MASTGGADRDRIEERIRSELRATLATYQELGPSYEDQVINSFVDRLQPVLRAQPAAAPAPPAALPYRRRRERPHFGILLILALVFGWFVVFGSGHHMARIGIERGGNTGTNIAVPVAPQQPAPGSSVQ